MSKKSLTRKQKKRVKYYVNHAYNNTDFYSEYVEGLSAISIAYDNNKVFDYALELEREIDNK